MTVLMKERYKGRSGGRFARKVEFLLWGTDDDGVAITHAENNAPAEHNALVLQKIDNLKQLGPELWSLTAFYGALDLSTLEEPEPGTASYTFNARIEEETYFYSIERLAKLPEEAPEIVNGLIGGQLSGGQGRAVGITVPAGPVTDTVTYEFAQVVIPASYRETVLSMLGAVSNQTFLGHPPGTTRFVGVNSSITAESKQTIQFDFAYRPRRQLILGEHDFGIVDGWDFGWTVDDTVVKTDTGLGIEVPFVEPLFAYLERLLPRVDLNDLDLPEF